MAIHFQAFREDLYTEHLEEGAFQYETRLNWLKDDEIGWQDLADIDSALEAHIDALVVGDTLALKVCLAALEDAEPGMLHVIVRVFCRHRLIDRLGRLWATLDFEDAEKVEAVSDAMKFECPPEWFASLNKVFTSAKTKMFPLLCNTIAARNPDAATALVNALKSVQRETQDKLLWAIAHCGRSHATEAIRQIAPLLTAAEGDAKYQTAISLMMLGEGRTLGHCEAKGKLSIAFALGGDEKSMRPVIKRAKAGTAEQTDIVALGIAGQLAAVPELLNYLKHPDFAEDAARALETITGAGLFEEEHQADEVEMDELFEHEIEGFKKGELPKNIDGNPFGSEVKTLSKNRGHWDAWLQRHKQQFEKGLRYRSGQPTSPQTLLTALIDNQTPQAHRLLTYEELVIRYGLDLPFLADGPVAEQQLQLNAIWEWVRLAQSQFSPGRWYFDGKAMV